jgi:hypothetical protein
VNQAICFLACSPELDTKHAGDRILFILTRIAVIFINYRILSPAVIQTFSQAAAFLLGRLPPLLASIASLFLSLTGQRVMSVFISLDACGDEDPRCRWDAL